MSVRFDDDDEVFLRQLRGAMAVADPVPAAVLDFAKLAPSIIPMDTALTTLLDDAPLDAVAGVRDATAGRHYHYDLAGASAYLDVTPELVVGELDDPSWSVSVHYVDDEVALSSEEGVFMFAPRARRFVVQFRRDEEVVATDWLRA